MRLTGTLITLALAAALLAAACGGSSPKPTPMAAATATATPSPATPTPTVPLPTVSCDRPQVTYRGEVVRIADSDGAGRPGLEMRVFASSPQPCILRRGGIDAVIVWYPNRIPQKQTSTGSYDLLPHPRAEINAYLPEAQPVARFLWKNSCTVSDARVKLAVDSVAFFDDHIVTTECSSVDATTDLVLLPVTLRGPTPPALEQPLPAGYSEVEVDLTKPSTLHVVVSADAQDDGRACEKLFRWMVPPDAPVTRATMVATCAFAGYGRPHFAAKSSDPSTLYLWRAEILLPALSGLPGERLNMSCEEILSWVVDASADAHSATYGTTCDARVVSSPSIAAGKRIWVDVFESLVNDVPVDVPCWQLSALLGTFAGEGRTAPVQCVMY